MWAVAQVCVCVRGGCLPIAPEFIEGGGWQAAGRGASGCSRCFQLTFQNGLLLAAHRQGGEGSPAAPSGAAGPCLAAWCSLSLLSLYSPPWPFSVSHVWGGVLVLRKGSREKWIASTRFPPCWGRGPTVPSHHSLQVWLPRLSASDWSICALARLSFWNRALLTYRCWPGMGLLALLYPVAAAEPPGVLSIYGCYRRDVSWACPQVLCFTWYGQYP